MIIPASMERFDRVDQMQQAVASAFSDLVEENVEVVEHVLCFSLWRVNTEAHLRIDFRARPSLGSDPLVLGRREKRHPQPC